MKKMKNYRNFDLIAVAKIFGAIIMALVGWKIMQQFGILKTNEEKKEQDDLAEDINALANAGYDPSYTDSEYNQMASTLYEADGYFDDDEEAIESIAKKMKNDLDIQKLNSALISSSYGANLAVYLADVFNRDEINDLWNAHTMANGCTIVY